jgi:hypothetical protein
MYGVIIAAVSATALMLAANDTFARSGAAPGGSVSLTHSFPRQSFTQSFRLHRRNGGSPLWPAAGGVYGATNGDLLGDVVRPRSNNILYTYTYDVPWDWAHRYPPNVAPSERAYVPSCSMEAVTVPGRGGKSQAVNITRCY